MSIPSGGSLRARASLAALVLSLLALQSCGGGGGGGSSTTASADGFQILDSFGRNASGGGGSFSRGDSGADGSAGDGAPIANALVTLTGLTGTPVTTTTDAQGYYRAKVNGLTAPLLVTVTKPNGGGIRYSFSTAALVPNTFVTINVSGLTTQLASDVAVALGQGAGASALTPALLNSQPTVVAAALTASLAAQKTQLATILGAAGVSSSSYNPIGTPFVTNHTGYDYVLDNTVVTVPATGATTAAPLAAFNPIVGAWNLASIPSVFFTFTADGHYTMSQGTTPANSVATLQSWPGLEYGTYSYNSSTGDLNLACPTVDTNGTAGTSGGYTGGFNDSGVPVGTCSSTPVRSTVVNGNTITLTNPATGDVNTFTRVADSTNAIVGSWALVDATLPAPGIFTFTADGHYMYAQPYVTGTAAADHVWPGIEYGTYTWNAATGALSLACPQVDTNGTAGSQGPYASFTDGLISSGNTPVGTVGGGQPGSACPATALNSTIALAGNSMTANFPVGGTKNLNRVIYGNYDLAVSAEIRREQSFFAGTPSRFQNGLAIYINGTSTGSASSYDSVRITGTGLPTTGLWYVRSAASSQFAMTTVRSVAPQSTATLSQAMVCPDCSSFWISRTLAVSGPNASVLGSNPGSAPASFQWGAANDGSYNGVTGVRPSLGSVYTFNLYQNAILVATEVRTLQSNLVQADQAVNLAWNDVGPNTLAALDATNAALNGPQNTLLIDWTLNPSAEPIRNIWVSQTNGGYDNGTSFLPTDSSVLATPHTSNGSTTQFTGMTGTPSYNAAPFGGYREIGFSYRMLDGSSKNAVYTYYP